MFKLKIFSLASFIIMACGNTAPKDTVYFKPATESLIPSDVTFTPLTPKQKEFYAAAAAKQYKLLLEQRGFSGSILLAKNGEIVFEDYHGYIDLKKKEPLSENTPTHIASTSKTFTAMVILHLMEQGKIDLENHVENYLPSFPYKNITVKNLLTHRSGLPNYTNFMQGGSTEIIRKKNKKGKVVKIIRIVKTDTKPLEKFVTNTSLLKYLADRKPPILASPDRVFNYCNTNFALLALIAEKVTGQAFPQYMKDSVFTPLGMTHSYVFNIDSISGYIPSYQPNGAPFRLEQLDCIYGDKNVYSTVRDLLQWDIALYKGTFVTLSTLERAFHPTSNEKRSEHNYGFGFRLLVHPKEIIVYHNGWWHGNNTVFKRLIKDTATVIVLGNKFNRNIYAAGKISSVFTGAIDTTKTID